MEQEKKLSAGEGLGLIVLSAACWLFEGFVLMKIWNWHLVPLFSVVMTYPAALALDMFVGVLVYQAIDNPNDFETRVKRVLRCFDLAIGALLFAWILKAVTH